MDKIFPKHKRTRKAPEKVAVTRQVRRKCSEGLHSLDIFGEQINLTYKGRETFTTLPGAFGSLIILLTILAFTVFRFYVMVNRLYPTITQQTQMRDLNFEEPYRPQDKGFDFAFGLGAPLDPSYGTFSVNEVHFFFTNNTLANSERERVKEKKTVTLVECGTKYFNYAKKDELRLYGIDKMMCVQDKA
jgi:hypothetical protein